MFLTIHATVGAIIGEQVNNVWLAYILGFFSHLLLDLIPHGDKPPAKLKKDSKQWLHFVLKMSVIDGIVMIITLLLFFQNNLFSNTLSVLFGVAGAITPDICFGLYLFTATPWLKKIYLLHGVAHYVSDKFDYPLLLGFILQLIILILLIFLLIKL